MKQATALYGTTDVNEPEATGTAMTMLKEDLDDLYEWTVFQTVIMGDPKSYSVEFTLHFPDWSEPTFDQAEDYEVL